MRISIDRAIQILDPEHREHFESLDAVKEACRMGMEALKALRWIPVEEAYPDPRIAVLVSYSSGIISIDAMSGDEWMSEDAYDGRITHWMPLPQSPNK